MSEIKARLFGAITVMDESSARRLWEVVEKMYSDDGWSAVEEAAPDAIDLQMIRDAQSDPDCASAASDEEVRAILG